MTPTRNIRQVPTGYQVRCYRRHGNTLYRTYATLRMARTALRRHEAAFPARRPWSDTPRKAQPRTTAVIRAERLAAGKCQFCGLEPHRPGRVSCQGCADVKSIKRVAA